MPRVLSADSVKALWSACRMVVISVSVTVLLSLFSLVSQSRQLESETGTTEEHSLNKEARKWATRVAREHKNIVHQQRVSVLENQATSGLSQMSN